MSYHNPVKIAVVGVGHMGRFHALKLKNLEDANISGVWDIDTRRARDVAEEVGVDVFVSLDEAVQKSDAIILATPTKTHGKLGIHILEGGCHLFIEKPIAKTEEEGELLIDIAEEHNRVLMVGHIENFNPAFIAAKKYIKKPLFIESHRLTSFRGRGTDVSVIDDLMIHDIELITNFCGYDVKSINASAAAVLSESPDIANVRIAFENGCVANLTASRLSISPKRKMRIFQKKSYVSIDFEKKVVEVAEPIGMKPTGQIIMMGNFGVELSHPEVVEKDALEMEISTFVSAILENKRPETRSYLTSLKIVKRIAEEMEK